MGATGGTGKWEGADDALGSGLRTKGKSSGWTPAQRHEVIHEPHPSSGVQCGACPADPIGPHPCSMHLYVVNSVLAFQPSSLPAAFLTDESRG